MKKFLQCANNVLDYGAVAAVALLASANSATADSIGLADFGPTAVLTDLNNLGNFAAFNAPLTVGIYTFTTDDGIFRYQNFGVGNSLALGDNTDLGFINIAIAPGSNVTKFGFYVGLTGEAQVNRETVSFFDTNNVLLGTIGVSRDGGLEFVALENAAGIGSALVTDILINSSVVTVDNLLVEQTPIPPTALLFGSGLGALGLLGWRRKRKNAAAIPIQNSAG